MSTTKLNGRVALVSGALRGIGRACAECLTQEGARVVLSDLDEAESDVVAQALSAMQGSLYVQLDATSERAWRKARDVVAQELGRLDCLVNNVGTGSLVKFHDLEYSEWQRTIQVTLDTAFLGIKTLQALLAETGARTAYGSSVINISSIMGIVGQSGTAAYNAAKGGVGLLSKSTAVEFAEERIPIRVNSIHPGFVEIPQLHQAYKEIAKRAGNMTAQDLMDGMAAATPIGRLAQPVEIGKVAAFLASDDSSYMTGSEVVVDGGWTAR